MNVPPTVRHRLMITLWCIAWLSAGMVNAACDQCHQHTTDVRTNASAMMLQIRALGDQFGDPRGCVVCHGGNPSASSAELAHSGSPINMPDTGPRDFYPDPGQLDVAEHTCGQCHANYVYRVQRSLMATEAGKIQAYLHSWGLDEVQNHQVPWGNAAVDDSDGQRPLVGTPAYKDYMQALIEQQPQQFPQQLAAVPTTDLASIASDPKQAGLVQQQRQQQQRRQHQTALSCSSCHMGSDANGGNHRLYGSRDAGAIAANRCNNCHQQEQAIGNSYRGLMALPNGGQLDPQHTTTSQYLSLSPDLHHQPMATAASHSDQTNSDQTNKGLLCQDCHTSIDVHGDGNIAGANLAQVEIECQDCHGTPSQWPWQLPLGYGEEFGRQLSGEPRGLSQEPAPEAVIAHLYDAKDGYLLTARGNPFGNLVKQGEQVWLHSASGHDIEVPLLKNLAQQHRWSSIDGMVAMDSIEQHIDRLECYACHATWVPQYYGQQMQWDFSQATEVEQGQYQQQYRYWRWETPVLGINGEGRVSPLMPLNQFAYTVIGADGRVLALQQSPAALDEANDLRQSSPSRLLSTNTPPPLSINMAPVAPHTSQRQARPCASCHNNAKAQGYGLLPGASASAVDDPAFDWTRLVDRRGRQLQTVGSHWPLSRALGSSLGQGLDRSDLCMGCHREMSDDKLWRQVSSQRPLDNSRHSALMNQMLRAYLRDKQRDKQRAQQPNQPASTTAINGDLTAP